MKVIERAERGVRCLCGALLRYSKEDVDRQRPAIGNDCAPDHFKGLMGGWPHVVCPECNRAVLISGVL